MFQQSKLIRVVYIFRYMCSLRHTPVMADEVITNLKPESGKVYLDMTFGAGGHSERILKSVSDNSLKILALDRDPIAYKCAIDTSKKYPQQIVPLLGRFSELPTLLNKLKIKQNSIDGILFDFGCSSMQLDEGYRGFSVVKCGPLDMRMDNDRFADSITAADLLANCTEEDLVKILKVYGNEKRAKKIAQAIIETRYNFMKLETTEQLATLICNVLGDDQRRDKLNRPTHVATKVFQALRIFVNNELNEINYGLLLAHRYLKIGGRLVTLTFHSLEDTIVKRHIANQVDSYGSSNLSLKYLNFSETYDEDDVNLMRESCWKSLHKHVLIPSNEEIDRNPRSRSAKLRAAVKLK